MQLYSVIDIKEEKCVRLTQGLLDQVKMYSDISSDMVKLWVERGASFLHLVDLDGVLAGSSVNEDMIRSIVQAVSVPIQIGGGIRNQETVQYMLNLDAVRTIIRTKAVQNPGSIRELVVEFGPEHIVAGMDARDGMVAIKGWEKVSSISALDLYKQTKEYGIRRITYTDIARDDMLSGPNVIVTKRLTTGTGVDIIIPDDVPSVEDLRQLYEEDIRGVIIGKTPYEKQIGLEETIACSGQDL